MTHADFCAWLAGYLTDREKPDADVILKKLGEVHTVWTGGIGGGPMAPNPPSPGTGKWTYGD